MKIVIDFDKKEIVVEDEKVKMGELVEKLEQILPRTWECFTLINEAKVVYNYTPIYVEKYRDQFWQNPFVYNICNDGSLTTEYPTSGTFVINC
jgi:hypothetical protein